LADYLTQGYSALVGVLILFFHNATVANWGWLAGSHVALFLGIHALIRLHARWRSSKLLELLRYAYPLPLYAWLYGETGWLNRMFVSQYLDTKVIGWEQSVFGCQPSLKFMEAVPWLAVSEVFYAAYFSYYLMIGGVGLALYFRDRRQFLHYVSVISFIFYVCYVIYIFLPIVGPPVFFREFAGWSLPDELQKLAIASAYPDSVKPGIFFRLMAWIYRGFEAPGAAMPSSHVAIAISTAWFSFRYLRAIRYFHLVMATLLCLATVYCRYHYALDVITGVIAVAILLPVGNWLYFRIYPTARS
jgi:membrane-associated phospholipid phosphatase